MREVLQYKGCLAVMLMLGALLNLEDLDTLLIHCNAGGVQGCEEKADSVMG